VEDELRSVRNKGVTEQEVRRAKERFLNSQVFNYDTPKKVLRRRMQHAYKGMDQDSFRELIREVRDVEQKDVERVARTYLHPDELMILMVGNKKDLDKDLSAMEQEVRELELTSDSTGAQ